MPRAVIYTRISADPSETGLGVGRQEKDCQALCESQGWAVVEVCVDNDRSAYSGAPRPAYAHLCGLLAARQVDLVVAWHPDRLHRSPRELEDFIDLLEAAGATVATCTAGALDLSTPAGRMTARVVGAMSRHESEQKSTRLRRKALELAEAGKVGGGGTRPFGFEADRVTFRPDEAAVIRDAADRLLAGSTIRAVTAAWNDRGVASVTGARWSHKVVKDLLCSARIAGLRQHRGSVVGTAVWPAIITPEERERIVAAVASRAHPRGPSRRYLLTGGIAVCGLCDTPLYARPRGDGRPCYVCSRDFGGCGRIRSLAEPFESMVVAQAVHRARRGEFTPQPQRAIRRDTILAELADLTDRQRALATDHYVTGDLADPGQFRAATRALDDRIASARRRLAALDDGAATARLRAAATTLGDRWDGLTDDERRTAVAALVARVVVSPAVKGRNRFDPDRVAIEWAT